MFHAILPTMVIKAIANNPNIMPPITIIIQYGEIRTKTIKISKDKVMPTPVK